MYHLQPKFVEGIIHHQCVNFCWCPTVTTLQHGYSPLLCCKVSLIAVLSFWWRDHNHTDSYCVSMADVPVSPITSGEGDPWQCQQYEPLHCHDGWWGSLPPSVVAFSRVWDKDDYTCPAHRRLWPVSTKLVFDQIAAPVPKLWLAVVYLQQWTDFCRVVLVISVQTVPYKSWSNYGMCWLHVNSICLLAAFSNKQNYMQIWLAKTDSPFNETD
jgi:hypothetical protein